MMDYLLGLWISSMIESSKASWMLGSGASWKPGDKLKLLFVGYNGARNTGADVRVEEMLRQVRHVLGPEQVELSVLTQNYDLTRGYFAGSHQVRVPDVFPPFLYRELPHYHGVIACEGSMFKSKFANALTMMMVGSLGIAAARNRLSVGYGGEAGRMDGYVRRMCRRYASESFVVTRNVASRDILRDLGITTEVGTDSAWTFEPHPRAFGEKALRSRGWDGKAPVLVICPINPFWWPVRASLAKGLLCATTGMFREQRYRSVYFHNAGPDVDRAYRQYLEAIANAVSAFKERHACFPICVAMERLDAHACTEVARRIGEAPVFSSADFDMYELVSIVRCGSMMASSRYHGIVTAMPGLVPSAGITMDERIRNLMHDRGHEDLLMTVDQPDLEPRLLAALETLHNEADRVRDGIGRNVVKNLKEMARMGVYFENHLRCSLPDFPIPGGIRPWEHYLPPFSDGLQRLVDQYDR